jgi:hypothetical protein
MLSTDGVYVVDIQGQMYFDLEQGREFRLSNNESPFPIIRWIRSCKRPVLSTKIWATVQPFAKGTCICMHAFSWMALIKRSSNSRQHRSFSFRYKCMHTRDEMPLLNAFMCLPFLCPLPSFIHCHSIGALPLQRARWSPAISEIDEMTKTCWVPKTQTKSKMESFKVWYFLLHM